MFPGTGPLSVLIIIKRRGGDVKIKNYSGSNALNLA